MTAVVEHFFELRRGLLLVLGVHQGPPPLVAAEAVLESLEMIVGHKDILLWPLLTRLVGSDCSYIGSWKRAGDLLRVVVDNHLILEVHHQDSPFFVVPPSYFVVDIGRRPVADLDIPHRAYN